MKEQNERLLKQKEVADLIAMSQAWLEACRFKRMGIPYIKIGRAVRYRESDVLKWLDERKSQMAQ